MIHYGSHGKQLSAGGYAVIPLAPGKKGPAKGLDEWVSLKEPPDYWQYRNCGIGIRCGTDDRPVYALDIDVMDASFIQAFIKEASLDKYKYRIGNPPKRLYVFKGMAGGLRKRTSIKYVEGHIEVLGFGQQFAAFGIHPGTGRPYQWPAGSILGTNYEDLPILTAADAGKLIKLFIDMAECYGFEVKEKETKIDDDHIYEPDNPLFEKEPIGMSESELTKIVNTIDPDCGRDMWRNIGFALHHETNGSDIGYRIWDAWSAKGLKYKEGETEHQWDSFGKNNLEPITAAYLKKLYSISAEKESEKILSRETGVDPDDPFASLNWSVDRFETEPPPLEMVVEAIIPKGITVLLYSAGGAGKSTLMLYLASRTAYASFFPCGFAGYSINGGSVVILTAEDPDVVLHRRYSAMVAEISRELGVEQDEIQKVLSKKLHIVSTFGKSIQLFTMKNETVRPTKGFLSFLQHLKTIDNLQFIIIDTKTRYSPGEGTGNVTATQEITYYEMIASVTGATVILLHHTSKKSRDGSQDGSQAYRDATALFDSVRAAWFFRPVTKKEALANNIDVKSMTDYFIFENAKNNYVRRHGNKIVHRVGYRFDFTDAVVTEDDKNQLQDRNKQDLIDAIVMWMQSVKEAELRQAEILSWCKNEYNIGRSRVMAALSAACDDGIIELVDGGVGKTKRYGLTEYGIIYNLHID